MLGPYGTVGVQYNTFIWICTHIYRYTLLQKWQVYWPYVLHIYTVETAVLENCSTAYTLNKPGKVVYVYDEFVQ